MKLASVFAMLGLVLSQAASAEDFYRMDETLPGLDESLVPVFDFDNDGCLPSAGISRAGVANGGLKPSGSIVGECRSMDFLETSNTYHRATCEQVAVDTYCVHLFSLYFEKDQFLDYVESGHRHDWEHVAVWTKNGEITHGGYSAHGDLTNLPAAEIPRQAGRLKFVYHKDGIATHAMRVAKANEMAENPYGRFVTPLVVSWNQMQGDGVSNETLRDRLNAHSYGSANLPVKDSNFLNNINGYLPDGYPLFMSLDAGAVEYNAFRNRASGLCLDILEGAMANGTNVIQWHCSGAPWQAWHYDRATGQLSSAHDPNYCLDNGSIWGDGAEAIIWQCNGSAAQQFDIQADGVIRLRAMPSQVLDAYGTQPLDRVGTWSWWGGDNQRWSITR